MSRVQSTGSAAAVTAAAAEPAGTTGASLVPEGEPLSPGGIGDALGVLYTAMAQQRQSGLRTSESQVNAAEKKEQQALKDQQDALAREQSNQANQGRGFFSSIGHLVDDVTKDATHLDPAGVVEDSMADVKEAVNSPAFWNDVEKGALVVAKVAAVVG